MSRQRFKQIVTFVSIVSFGSTAYGAWSDKALLNNLQRILQHQRLENHNCKHRLDGVRTGFTKGAREPGSTEGLVDVHLITSRDRTVAEACPAQPGNRSGGSD